ncbi:alpha/beta hydrolase [Schleiferilactobacillus shenzhenensis]|uniref:alpha/beta hydrolase n=1 Tax=Schleiferilactobacillus shenzhenensis TaxID=1231337 RepID=UPI0004029A9B|nr:alpha/beta hydrolase [Schleiferilactobacillus shenzhenensis]
MKNRKWLGPLLIVIVLVVLGGGGLFFWQRQHNQPVASPVDVGHYHTPTLFVHGFGGGYGSEKDMINDLSTHPGFKQVLRFDIDASGKARVSGHWDAAVKYPLIAVVFQTGRPDANALVPVLTQLKKSYGIKSFNAVGHSAGSSAWVSWAVTNRTAAQPALHRLVTIAGPFNGFPGMDSQSATATIGKDGKPSYISPRYAPLVANRSHFPTTAAVLNLYGDLGHGTDSRVPVVSARALGYIVRGRAISYTERVIKNSKAQHSQLHEHNPLVNKYLYEFLTTGKVQ